MVVGRAQTFGPAWPFHIWKGPGIRPQNPIILAPPNTSLLLRRRRLLLLPHLPPRVASPLAAGRASPRWDSPPLLRLIPQRVFGGQRIGFFFISFPDARWWFILVWLCASIRIHLISSGRILVAQIHATFLVHVNEEIFGSFCRWTRRGLWRWPAPSAPAGKAPCAGG